MIQVHPLGTVAPYEDAAPEPTEEDVMVSPVPGTNAPVGFFPPSPETLEDTGLTDAQVQDLLLKTLHRYGSLQGDQLAEQVALPFTIIDDLLLSAQQRKFVEVTQAFGHGRGGYTFALTSEGQARAEAALRASRYIGSAPVPLAEFRRIVAEQSVRGHNVTRDELEAAFSDLIMPEGVIDALGPAVHSGGSIFLHGAPGNGKTAISERIGKLTSSTIYLPKALMIEGHELVLFDPVFHELVEEEEDHDAGRSPLIKSGPMHDKRFVKVKRPTVFVGGDLTMHQLDLQYDPYSKVYQAPFQLKAVGGVLIIDDFGRQRMRPEELLNRWVSPLENGIDNLTLHSGIKFPVPFDCILIFATNLAPQDLVDEAFLRRIQYKVEVRSPTRDAFDKIMQINCDQLGVPYRPEAVEMLFSEYYEARGFSPRGCHPRDLIKQIQAYAAFNGSEPTLDDESIHRAAHSYFLVTEEEYSSGIPSRIDQQGE